MSYLNCDVTAWGQRSGLLLSVESDSHLLWFYYAI